MNKFLLALSLVLVSISANADVLTFDNAPVGYTPLVTYTEGDFAFTIRLGSDGDIEHYGDATNTPATLNWHNGGDNGQGMSVLMTRIDNGMFDLNSFNLNYIDGILHLAANTGAVADYSVSGLVSPGFNGVSSVSFMTNNYAVEIDNVNTSNVPEPASLALFGLGIVGVAAARRRKQA